MTEDMMSNLHYLGRPYTNDTYSCTNGACKPRYAAHDSSSSSFPLISCL